MMIKWISKINFGKLVLVGVIYTVVATVIHQIEAVFTMKYYLDPGTDLDMLDAFRGMYMPHLGVSG